ncbi:MAG TPA: PAS domain-containing protein [Pyrinomonadaceae bacterium]|jgi:PAS domain S-box-containing protein
MEQTIFHTTDLAGDCLPHADADAHSILGAAFDALPDAFYLFDSEKRLSRTNRPGELLENAEGLKGRRCCEMFWRVEGSAECLVERAVACGEKVEVEVLAGPESDRPTLVTVVPLHDALRGLTGGAVVVARDISELRRAEAEAFEHKAFMSGLADLIPDEIYTLDTAGRITWMNERAEAANDLNRTALTGRPFSELVALESKEPAAASVRAALAGEETKGEIQAARADGAVRFVEAHTSPRWKDGAVAGAFVFLRDVTERRSAADRMAQSDKLRAVGELAAGVAHNLNNSLTVIQGRAQLLQRRAADEATSKSLETIIQAVADGAQTLRRILDFARREQSKEFALLDLAELVKTSVEIAKPKWQRKSGPGPGCVNVHVETRGPVRVLGEKAELREVVMNLLFNAVDAMPDGGDIEVGTRAELDHACFWVADTGVGMSPETVARIFEPFYTTKGERGTGLGLSASHGIITRHHGQIMVISEPGLGTRFEIRLPVYEMRNAE